MEAIRYSWNADDGSDAFDFVFVEGTHGVAYDFGEQAERISIEIDDFFISVVPVTQALWRHVLDGRPNPSVNRGPVLPLENVSWDDITGPGGFLERINTSAMHRSMLAKLQARSGVFRLPTETELLRVAPLRSRAPSPRRVHRMSVGLFDRHAAANLDQRLRGG